MKISLKQNPELKIAHTFVKESPGAIIAGGIARDFLTGKQYDDVDIFIPSRDQGELIGFVVKVTQFCIQNGLTIETLPGYGDGFYYLSGLRVNGRIKAGAIEFVFTDSFLNAESLIENFDMVSSQAWFKPTHEGFEVRNSPLFEELNTRKILGIYPHKAGGRGQHIERIKEKYPDYLPLELASQTPDFLGEDSIPF
jgi:hypothetical protein